MKNHAKENQHLDADVTAQEGLKVLLMIQLPISVKNLLELGVDYQAMDFIRKKNASYIAVSNHFFQNHIKAY